MDLESYTNHISTIVSGGYISCAMVIGRDLGLFDALSKLEKPVTSQQLADICNLKERYVREWLGCMVSSDIVLLDEEDNYFIPGSCKPGLEALNLLSFYSLMTSLLTKAKECFKKDGPPGYCYEQLPSETSSLIGQRFADWYKLMEQMLIPVQRRKDTITNILDLGSGSGMLSLTLAKQFPKADVYGVDFIGINVKKSTELAKVEGVANTTFIEGNVADLPKDWTKKFDWIILMDVLHDLPCPNECMQEVRRVLKDDGVVTIVDPSVHSDHRSNAGNLSLGVGYALSQVFCLPSSLSIDGAPGLGIGWGVENKERFLIEVGWLITDKGKLHNPYYHSVTCIKSPLNNESDDIS